MDCDSAGDCHRMRLEYCYLVVTQFSFIRCRQMRRYGPASKRKGEEDAEAQDYLQLVTVATVKQEISEDTVPSATRASRVGGQPGTDTDTGEHIE